MKSLHEVGYRDLFSGRDKKLATCSVPSQKRIVILSDCHLEKKFDRLQYNRLVDVLKSADQVIINGDLWYDKKISFDEFLHSKWSSLFPLLKQKHTIYVFGNHDMPLLSDSRILSFCREAAFGVKLTAGKLQFHIEHGHLLSTGLVRRVLELFEKHPRLLGFVTSPLGHISEWGLGSSSQRKKAITKKIHEEYKAKSKQFLSPNEYFVMGHTHLPEFDETEKYINLGRTHKGEFSYLVIQNNTIELVVLPKR